MSERNEGWYWVRFSDDWLADYWNGDIWRHLAIFGARLGDPLQIGPRIPAPDEAPPIGQRYRNEAGGVVAVVAPVHPDSAMIEAGHFAPVGIYGTGVVRCVEHYRQMLAALPEPD